MEQGSEEEERRVKNSSAPGTSVSSAAYADQADAVEVKTAGGRTYRFTKKDGRLMGVEVGNKAISAEQWSSVHGCQKKRPQSGPVL